ncbi:hypothetical protein CASFOL_039437 [Castilleja foliolosa]|uniref:Cystatin domain-containing protein n=1 Tax=Castilleja foliolosa TaxID=1961234 RepID=A0ABD3BIL1_9LAMI
MSRFVFVFLSILVFLTPNEASRPRGLVGNYRPIDNLNDPTVLEAAKFAVAEHNKKENTYLSLVNIVNGESQEVAGSIYRLDIFTNDAKIYRAAVWSRPWLKFLQLRSFEEIDGRIGYITAAPTPAPAPSP